MKYILENQDTQRLKFRLLKDSDYYIWLELFEDNNVSKVLGMDKIGTPEEQCKQWFEWTYERYNNDLGGQNILIEKSTCRIVGQCGLLVREIDGKKELEIGYSILPDFRRKGFASEASKKCRDLAFEIKFSKRLISIIHSENPNSEKVALKNGMRKNKTIEINGNKMNVFQIDIEEWKALKNKTLHNNGS